MLKKLSSEIKTIKSWINKSKVIDVILFGSFMRGKSKPNDIDLCILIKDQDEEKSLDLVDSLGKLTDKSKLTFQINILTASSFVKGNSLAKTLLHEGYSIKNDKKFSSNLSLISKSMIHYTLKNFSPSKRVKFHYLLRGRRGSKGILKEAQGEFLGTGTIMVPAEKEDFLKEIFDKWGVKYKIMNVLIG